MPGGFSDAGAVFPAGAACQLLHPGLLCTAGSDGRRDGGGGGLCARENREILVMKNRLIEY